MCSELLFPHGDKVAEHSVQQVQQTVVLSQFRRVLDHGCLAPLLWGLWSMHRASQEKHVVEEISSRVVTEQ